MKNCIIWMLFASLCSGCVSSTQQGAGAERRQLFLVSENYVEKRGNVRFERTSGDLDPWIYDADEERLVNIMNRLIPYAEEYLAEGEHANWSVHEWDTQRINSDALGNDAILLSKKFTRDPMFSDENIAFLIAHEMAHVIRHHPQELYSWKYFLSPALIVSSFLTSGAVSIATSAGQDVYNFGFKHSAEKEADLLGLEIYAKAGFDPKYAEDLLIKSAPLFKQDHPIASKIPSLVRSKPSFKARREAIRNYLAKVQPMYEHHVEKTSDHLIRWDFHPEAKVNHAERIKFDGFKFN